MEKIEFIGLEKLEKKLDAGKNMEKVKKTVKRNGAELQQKIMKHAEFTEGYQTGATHDSIRLSIKDGGLTAEAGPTTEYAPYLEYGTRFMEAQPFVKPALEEQTKRFFNDMKELMD